MDELIRNFENKMHLEGKSEKDNQNICCIGKGIFQMV